MTEQRLADLARAYEGESSADGSGPPTAWSAPYVAKRFIAAVRVGGRYYGPQGMRTAWPQTLVEFSDLVDQQAREAAELRMRWRDDIERDEEEEEDARLELPDLADEARAWPMQYLSGEPHQAVALILWSMGRAGMLKIRPMVRRMRLALATVRKAEALPRAGFTLLWVGSLREDAERVAERRLDVARIAAGHPYVASVTHMHRMRKRALETIRRALERDGVKVR